MQLSILTTETRVQFSQKRPIFLPKRPVALFIACCIPVFMAIHGTSFAACDQFDAPDCLCFNSTGLWDAGGPSPHLPIQEVALDTLNTIESCHLTADLSDNSGKPYYQFVIGSNNVATALTASYVLTYGSATSYPRRQEWCSEAISYWHREAGIPYPLGYRNEWHENWRNFSVPQLRTWYEQEEAGGKGRWIESGEVDYGSAELGVTLPTPGAYMAISCMHPNPSASWCDPAVLDKNHSVMVNEMWLHRDGHREIFRVEMTFIEGNSGRRVKNTWHLDDLFSVTTRGSQWLGYSDGADGATGTTDDWGKKVYGFGIALDAAGQPIYDSSRLHYVDHPYLRKVAASARPTADPAWNTFYLSIENRLTDYTQALRLQGGPIITCSAPEVKTEKIPNGSTNPWIFPQSLQNMEVTVEADFLKNNPLLIHGLSMFWQAGYIPLDYRVYLGKDRENYKEAIITSNKDFKAAQESTPIPVSAILPEPMRDIRYLKLVFPAKSINQDATLTELTIDYDHGPSEDSSEVSSDLMLFVDIHPGSCPNIVFPGLGDNTIVALLGSENVDVTEIDIPSIRFNGRTIPHQSSSFTDVATPFIGTDPACHDENGDGSVDLVFNFKTDDFADALGLQLKRGQTTPVIVTGIVKTSSDDQYFTGQDFVVVPGPAGDINGDGAVDLTDAITGLQVFAGWQVAEVTIDGDVDADFKVGMPEVLFVLETVAKEPD